MQVYIAGIMTLIALTGAVLFFRLPATPKDQSRVAYGVAVVASAFVIALLAPQPVSIYYKGAIVLGLALAAVAIGLLLSAALPTYVAHGHLVVVYVLYFTAFASQNGFRAPTLWVLLIVLGLVVLYFLINPKLREEWGAMIAYAVIMALALWQALELLVQAPFALPSLAAFTGMLIVVAVHVLQAWNRYRSPLRFLPRLLAVMLLAHCLIAWSVWGAV
jgi:hypothetical protein